MKRRARRNDLTNVEAPVLAAARAIHLALATPLPADLGRRAADLMRELHELEVEVLDGGDSRQKGEALVERYSTASVDDLVCAQLLLSAAWTRMLEMYPTKAMKGNIDAIAQLTLAHFGDVPVPSISDQDQEQSSSEDAGSSKSARQTRPTQRFWPT